MRHCQGHLEPVLLAAGASKKMPAVEIVLLCGSVLLPLLASQLRSSRSCSALRVSAGELVPLPQTTSSRAQARFSQFEKQRNLESCTDTTWLQAQRFSCVSCACRMCHDAAQNICVQLCEQQAALMQDVTAIAVPQ
jgi:hypothetical protein